MGAFLGMAREGEKNEKQEKKAFALRINPKLMQELERWAEDEFRSLNGQIEYLLDKAIKERKGKK